MSDSLGSTAEPDELRAAWRMVMEMVLDQRWQWADVAAKLKISQAALRALLAIDPHEPDRCEISPRQ